MSQNDEKSYDFPVFGTQGGGLVREVRAASGYEYYFVEAPKQCPMFRVGDRMPEEWGVTPANSAAELSVEEDFTLQEGGGRLRLAEQLGLL